MRGYIVIPITLMIALMLSACASNRFNAHRQISEIRLLDTIQVETQYDKAVCDPMSQTVFAMSKGNQGIDIYRHNEKINSIGGLGFERTNFQRLTDIGVDTDGGLLALDSAQKTLRKFSPEGAVVSEISLSALHQPELFCVSDDGNYFVYDAATEEIVNFTRLESAELYRFGRFEIQQPVTIACNHDYLYAYSEVKQSTYVFFLLGQFMEALPAQVVYDMFSNQVKLSDLVPVYSSMLPRLINVNNQIITTLFTNMIQIHRIEYARDPDAPQ